MKKYIYDVEVYPNFFCVSFLDYEEGRIYYFELSEYRNDIEDLREFLSVAYILIAFNSIHYDNLILNGALLGLNNERLYKLSSSIIDNKRIDWKFRKKVFKSVDVDLFLFWPRLTRMSKSISLKGLAAQLNFPKLQELPYPPQSYLSQSEQKEVAEYNVNDLNMTKTLTDELVDKIKFRFAIKDQYKIPCFSWDDVKIGTSILEKKYEGYCGHRDFLEWSTPRPSVKLRDIILPSVAFTPTELKYHTSGETTVCNSFHTLFTLLKGQEVKNTHQINYTVLYGGVKHDIKSGGIHSYHNPEIYEAGDGIIEDIDVASYYPSLGIEWKISPDHLPGLASMLSDIKKERLEHKRAGNKMESDALKLAMNGGYYGNLNNEYSWLYDWEKALKITVNGQLFLCMLSEWFTSHGIQVLMLNTDGITIRYTKEQTSTVRQLVKKWEDITRMEMESNFYTKLVVRDVNNYIWIKEDGSYKTKGAFKPYKDRPLGDNTDFCVLAKAWINYFVKGTPIEYTIKQEKDIFLFCKSPKVGKSYRVLHNGQAQQRLNRFFVSNSGAYIYKQKEGGRLENMLAGYPVQIINDCEETNARNYDINYDYYIAKANELVNALQPDQLKLAF